MTYSTLASIVKYPFQSTQAGRKRKFGFFQAERPKLPKDIAKELGIIQHADGTFARHPLVYLVEAADDICYEIMDIEDAHKLKILTTEETHHLLIAFFTDQERQDIRDRCSHRRRRQRANGVSPFLWPSTLEHECVQCLRGERGGHPRRRFQGSLIDHISDAPKAYKRCVAGILRQDLHLSKEWWTSRLLVLKVITHPPRPLHGSRHASRPCLFAVAPQPRQPAIRSGCPRCLPPHHGRPRLHLRHDRRLCPRPLPQNQWRKPANDLA